MFVAVNFSLSSSISPWITRSHPGQKRASRRAAASQITGCKFKSTATRRCECYDMYKEAVPFSEAWSWQKSIVANRKTLIDDDKDDSDSLIVLQHQPVYTLGTASTENNLNFNIDDSPLPLYQTDRGGEVTYHGPGQIVMYPIMNLRYQEMDLHWYLRALEEVVIRVLNTTFSLKASRVEGLTGVWVQGGPGGSGVGFGNFGEIGPLDIYLKPRNSTWLQKADLLFVDGPVGTGFSYVEDDSLYVKTDIEAATDLTTLLKAIYNGNATLQQSPLYIIAESYGGKFAVTLGLSALEAIEKGELKLQLGGVALGDSWISPEDYVLSWGPLLKDVSRIDGVGLNKSNSLALKIKQQLADGQYTDATDSWGELEGIIFDSSNNVDFYNFMLDEDNDPNIATTNTLRQLGKKEYAWIMAANEPDLDTVMNGPIRQKLKVIPTNVSWGGQANNVFGAMVGDFMKPRIAEVDELLSKGVNVTIYNGQIDLICATKGTEAWINKLKWDGLSTFLNLRREPLLCGKDDHATKAFAKSYKNFAFYWILGAGHFVPVDQPCVTLKMLTSVVNSPA